MLIDAIVFRAFGADTYAYFPTIGVSLELEGFTSDFLSSSNVYTQAGDQPFFIYRGVNTSGFNEGLAFSDGTNFGSIDLDINGSFINAPSFFSNLGSQAIFTANRASQSSSRGDLYSYDGVNLPSLLHPSVIEWQFVDGDKLYFQESGTGDIYVVETDFSPRLIFDYSANPSNQFSFSHAFAFQDELWVRGRLGNDNYYFTIDPDTGSFTRTDVAVDPGGESVRLFFNGVGTDKFYYWNSVSGQGTELFVTDGTNAGTIYLGDLNPGSQGSYTAENVGLIGDQLFFVANDGSGDGNELWTTDGTVAGTIKLSGSGTNVGALDLSDTEFYTIGDKILFKAANSAVGSELFISDGTEAGTSLLVDLTPFIGGASSSSSSVTFLGDYNGEVFFTFDLSSGPNNRSLWKTDGTEAGTQLVFNPAPGTANNSDVRLFNVLQLDTDNLPVYSPDSTSNDDVFIATLLRESFDGGAGFDWVDYDDSDAGVTVNLASGAVSGGHGEGDTLLNIEAVYGSNGFGDILVGNNTNNHLIGHGGNDVQFGGFGNDVLEGSLGDDTLAGEAGADQLDGGAGFDWAHYYDSNAGVTVNLLSGTVSGGHGEGDTLLNFEAVHGSNGFGDILVGNNTNNHLIGHGGNDVLFGGFGNDVLEGSLGDDTLAGEAGADSLDGGAGFDWAHYYDSNAGVTVNLLSGAVSGGHGEGDTLLNFEAVHGSNGFGDILVGNSTNNHLIGHGGNDVLFGGLGNDVLEGSLGDDTLAGEVGADYLDGGAGFDWVHYYDSNAGVSVNLFSGAVFGGHGEGDTLLNFEAVHGSNGFGDILVGNSTNNHLIGHGGNDVLDGYLGDDYLTGGLGNDTFVFKGTIGSDTITDFQQDGPSRDLIDFSQDSQINSIADLSISYSSGNAVISTGTGQITLLNIQPNSLASDDFDFV